MKVELSFRTDTATLAVFDPAVLECRKDDEPDWWTGEGDLEQEEEQQHLLFIDTKHDGSFVLVVTDQPPPPKAVPCKETSIKVPSGLILFGPAECLPGGGVAAYRDMGSAKLPAGLYNGSVYCTSPSAYWVFVRPAADKPKCDALCRGSQESPQTKLVLKPQDIVAVLDKPAKSGAVRQVLSLLPGWTQSTDDDSTWIECPPKGIQLVAESGIIRSIHLYADTAATRTQSAFKAYPFKLPHGLNWGAAQDSVKAAFGAVFKGTGVQWAIYRLPTYGVRVGFSNGKLVSVNLLSLEGEVMKS